MVANYSVHSAAFTGFCLLCRAVQWACCTRNNQMTHYYPIASFFQWRTFSNFRVSLAFANVFKCENLYCASGCGALGYHKFMKVSVKLLFSSNSRKFSPAKETR